MEQAEFTQRMALLQDLMKEANKLKKSIAAEAQKIPGEVNLLLPSISSRDELFIKYLNLLQEFQYSDKLTSPSDLFPGIRTAAEMADPEELSNKAEVMKTTANQIDNLQKKASSLNNAVVRGLKRCIAEICEYIQQENQIYDLALDLLQDADSIYDIGQIAKNT